MGMRAIRRCLVLASIMAALLARAEAPGSEAPPPLQTASGVQRHDAALPPRLQTGLAALGIGPDYAHRTGLTPVAEANELVRAGRDRAGRPLRLMPAAAGAWQAMRDAAAADGIALDAISGYRSHDHQRGIFQRKLARGQTLDQILAVNAAPGYSEHHSGRAVDIAAPGQPPLQASFALTPAFAWLQTHAGEYGFVMSYPHDNPHGLRYEPWHWHFVR
jgi:D-alanyl-D-alanine carboxypeptidase